MSLNSSEQRATAKELAANLTASGLSTAELSRRLDLYEQDVEAALQAGGGASPVDVWRVRDAIEDELVAQGKEPLPYSKLTESHRADARRWFGYQRTPSI